MMFSVGAASVFIVASLQRETAKKKARCQVPDSGLVFGIVLWFCVAYTIPPSGVLSPLHHRHQRLVAAAETAATELSIMQAFIVGDNILRDSILSRH
jgi:hypothetical protein